MAQKKSTRVRAEHRSREQWRSLVAEWRGSGLTQAAFAARHGVGQSTFSRWRRRIEREEREDGGFVQLVASGSREDGTDETRSCQSPMRMATAGGVVFEWAESPDPAYVAELARRMVS